MDSQPQQTPDNFGYVETLRMVLHDPALNHVNPDGSLTPETTSAILLLAQTIGYCRLYGIVVPEELDGSLPASTAVSAIRILMTVMHDAMQDADAYAERWELCRSQEEMELLACDLLRVRMHAWSIFVAIDEAAVATARDQDPDTDDIERMIEVLVDAIQRFDVALRRDEELLISALETRLIENWRSMLSDEYQMALPWWLDGTLERTATRIQQSINSSNPVFGISAPQTTTEIVPLVDLQRFARLQAIPAPPVLVAQSSIQPPHQAAIEWRSPNDLSGITAKLLIPRQRDASENTTCRLQFHGTAKESLVGLPVGLGTARAIIQSRELPSLPGARSVEAVFVLEQFHLQDGHFRLLIQGQRWMEVQPEE